MKSKITLALFGTVIGLLLVVAVYPLLKRLADDYARQLPDGSQFESLDQFKRAMLVRGPEDMKADRSVSLRSIITPHPDNKIIYDLLPNLDVRFQGVRVETNSCSFRDSEYPIEKSADTYRIAMLGDSFAFGWGVKVEESFANVIEQQLNQYLDGKVRVELLNFGVPGYSTFQQVALFKERALDYQPDAVLIYFVDNDFGLPFFIKDMHNEGSFMRDTTFARKSWKRDDPLINQERRRLERLLDPNRAMLRLLKTTSKNSIDFFVTINPRRNWRHDKKRLWAINQRKAINFLNLREDFLKLIEERNIDVSTLSLKNDPHPSAAKHQLLGEILAARLLPHVLKRVSLP